MKKGLSFSEFMTHRITLSVEAVLAAFAPLLFWACRPSGHGFIDIYSFDGASQLPSSPRCASVRSASRERLSRSPIASPHP